MKKIFSFVFLFIAILLFAKMAFAQSTTSSAVNITFPIAELGNCTSAQDCKTYCDDPTHLDACIAYAKEKGFYKESELDTNQQAILSDAETTFGCTSLASCRAYCQDTSHQDACSAFAQKHNLQGGKQETNNKTLEQAKIAFGCNSVESCKAFCDQEANHATCESFAKAHDLHSTKTVGPGGCTSEESCKVFCSNPNNFQTCSNFMQTKVGSSSGEHTFTGPGGCTSEQSCRSFCSQNPTACHLNPEGHEAAMSATAAARIEENMQKRDDCREHPERCRQTGSQSGTFQNVEDGRNNFRPSNQFGPRPSGQPPQGGSEQPPQNGAGSEGQGRQGSSGGPSGNFGEVEGAATHRDFFQWFVDQLFHLR